MDEELEAKVAPRAGRRARHMTAFTVTSPTRPLEGGAWSATTPAAPPRSTHLDERVSSTVELGVRMTPTTPNPAPAPADPLADDGSGKKFTGVSRRKQEQAAAAVQQEQARVRSKYQERAQEAVNIPELEEEGKEDLTRVVAAAPKVRANKIQGLHELDQDAGMHLPRQQDRDIDLSILTAVLCSSEMVHEPDEVWYPELLLSQVAAEFTADKDRPLEPTESFPTDMPPM